MHETDPAVKVLSQTRRGFLKCAMAATAIVAFDGWQALEEHNPGSDTPEPSSRNTSESLGGDTPEPSGGRDINPINKPMREYDHRLKEEDSVFDTIGESLVATGAATAYTALANNKHVRLYSGNSGSQEIMNEYRQNKLKTILTVTGIAPVAEESLFRALPAVFGKKESIMPVRGIISTYLFGKIHQLGIRPKIETINTGEKEAFLDKNKVPVQQYVLGGLYWMMARRRGVKHSMIAHATTNATALALHEVTSRKNIKGPAEAIGDELHG